MASIGSRVKKMLQMAENIVNNTTDSKSNISPIINDSEHGNIGSVTNLQRVTRQNNLNLKTKYCPDYSGISRESDENSDFSYYDDSGEEYLPELNNDLNSCSDNEENEASAPSTSGMVQVNTVSNELVALNDISGICGPFESISQGMGFIFIPPLENITTEVSNKRKRARRGKPNTDMWKQNLRKRNPEVDSDED